MNAQGSHLTRATSCDQPLSFLRRRSEAFIRS